MIRGFIYDREACVGCEACVVACSIANRGEAAVPWRHVFTFNPKRLPGLPVFFYSLACNHCMDAPCIPACPATAYSRDPVTGAVLLNADECIGCRYCTWACPYDAPQFNDRSGTMEKCTFCTERLAAGEEPACVAGCPVDALTFGTFEPEKSIRASGFPDSSTKPVLKISGHELPPIPDTSYRFSLNEKEHADINSQATGKISLRKEWSLLLFTLLVPLMTGMLARYILHPGPAAALLFTGTGLLATGFSLMHLGKPLRAWKALRHVNSSWLSREIAGFGLSYGLSILYLLIPDKPGLGISALAFWVLTLWIMDQVYRYARIRWLFLIHSSSVLLTGLLWISIAWMQGYAILFILFLKTGLYLVRKMILYRYNRIRYLPLLIIRLLALTSAAFYLLTGPAYIPLLFSILLAGEIADRAEFYLEQEINGISASFSAWFKK